MSKRKETPLGPHRLQWLKDNQNPKYELPKWVQFIEICQDLGLKVWLIREAKTTRSKYLRVSLGGQSLVVRFSNHRPKKTYTGLVVGRTWDDKFFSTVAVLNYIVKAFNLREPGFKRLPTEWSN